VLGLSDPRVWEYGGALALLWAALLSSAGAAGRPLALFGCVWFFGALGPNANLVASTFPMQDRYMYLASVGLLLAVCVAARGAGARWPAVKRVLPAAGVVYVGLLAALCAGRSQLFGNDAELELDAARRQPDSGMARFSAAAIWRERFLIHANSTRPDDQRRAADDARMLLGELEDALACRDVCDFVDPLTVRVCMAEVLHYQWRDEEARTVLEAAMPPPGPLPALTDIGALFPGMVRPGHRVKAVWFRESVARGHILLGELSRRASYLKTASAEERMARAREAVARADQALAIAPRRDEATVLKGKALVRIAYVQAAGGAMDEARKTYDEGKAILLSLPDSSPLAASVRQILANVPPPDAPDSEPQGIAP